MFDRAKLEHFLAALEVETHFPSGAPKKIIVDMAPRSHLDGLMDKYDLFVQGNFNHNYGTTEFPIYGPQATDQWSNPMYMPIQWGLSTLPIHRSYAAVLHGIQAPTEPEKEDSPTPHDRFKDQVHELEVAKPVKLANPKPAAIAHRAPDYTATMTGWRAWDVSEGLLEAVGNSYRWKPRRAEAAVCRSGAHEAPKFNCNCGFWSFKTLDLLLEARKGAPGPDRVVGPVEIWGRVIECENGFRSEFAYPKELWLLKDGLESLSWIYGVPVRRLG